ncbi:MAG: DNA translocase FtsK [Clostridiales bacterium]|nr:DNA translocase FtsK [Clostridiales bacterium]
MASKKQTTTSNSAASGRRTSGGKQSSTAKKRTSSAAKKGTTAKKTTSASAAAARRRSVWISTAVGVLLLLLAVFSLLSCFGVDAILLDWLVALEGGLVGYAWLLMPPVLAVCGVLLLLPRRPKRLPLKLALVPLVAVCISAMMHTFAGSMDLGSGPLAVLARLWQTGMAHTSGGVLGGLLAVGLVKLVSRIGSILMLLLMLFVSLLLLTDTTPDLVFQKAAAMGANRKERLREQRSSRVEPEEPSPEEPPLVDPATGEVVEPSPFSLFRRKKGDAIDVPMEDAADNPPPPEEAPPVAPEPEPEPEPPQPTPAPSRRKTRKPRPPREEDTFTEVPPQPVPDEELYRYPPVELLQAASGTSRGTAPEELNQTQLRLSDTLHSFGISGEIVGRTCGPSVTRFDLLLDQGVKLSKVTNLAGDLALSLGAVNVRIAPVPGKSSVVGIEVPNQRVSPVPVREVLDSEEFRSHPSHVAFAVGRDIANRNIVGDIARLPHLLIAGTTGSGKSVCTNALIVSLLYKSSPRDVRLIMVDPKMVELGVYNGIPHLLIPVVTDPKKAAGALQWAVYEMMRRYKDFSEQHVRDLESYNKLAEHADKIEGAEGVEHKPQIVIVIDELADLMLVAAKEVEESICRVAQMGRAAGIHLIIATQRPSTDVITGLMKANIPSRIAFAVASSLESRIILDQVGAEKLVGKGDMLFAPLGIGKPMRVQGCLVTEEEVSDVIKFIKENSTANYDADILAEVEQNAKNAGKGGKGASAMNVAFPDLTDEDTAAGQPDGEQGDELLPQAVDVVMETGMASVSMLQRRLKLGYSRAARLVDQMEERGIVGPFEGSKPRKVLITKEQWQERKLQGGQFTVDDYAAARVMSEAADAESGLPRPGQEKPIDE